MGVWKYILLLVILPGSLLAQETVYSLNQYTPLRYNPSYSVLDYAAGLSLFHEEYSVGAGDFINTNSLNAEWPFIQKESGRRLLGLGLSFLGRDAGQSDLLQTYDVGLSVATPIQLTGSQFLNFGAGLNYVNKRTSMENLSTGSQWIASEFRYDPNATLGESFSTQNINYLSLSAGLSWTLHADVVRHTMVSVSGYDLNQPTESFFEEASMLPATWVAFAESVLYQNHRLAFTPSFYYVHRGEVNSYKAFLSTKLLFEDTNPYDILKSGNIDLQLSYGFSGDAAASIMLNQPNFSAGFSYNFPITNDNPYLESVMQVGLSFKKTLWKPKPQIIVIESTPTTRLFDFEERRQPIMEKSEMDQVRDQLTALDEVKSLQFELDKDFKFDFGGAELPESAHEFLDDLIRLMDENPQFTLSVIGHTDNVGSKNANYELSVKRAQVVADYLVEGGLETNRIAVVGRGDTEPVSDNDTEEGKAKNRRVEFLIQVTR